MLDHRGVVRGDEVVQHLRTATGPYPVGAEDILLRQGNAGKRADLTLGAARIGGPGLGQGRLGGDGDEAVELAVDFPDAREKAAGQLLAGEIAAGQPGGKFG